jgi:hypothetical protein
MVKAEVRIQNEEYKMKAFLLNSSGIGENP